MYFKMHILFQKKKRLKKERKYSINKNVYNQQKEDALRFNYTEKYNFII